MRRRPTGMLTSLIAVSLLAGAAVSPVEAQALPLSSSVSINQMLPVELRDNATFFAFGALTGVGVLAAVLALFAGENGSSVAPVQPTPTFTPIVPTTTTKASTSTTSTTATTSTVKSTTTTTPFVTPTTTVTVPVKTPATTPSTITPTTTPTTAAPAVTPTGFQADMAAAVNEYRASENSPALSYDGALQQVAQSYAQRSADTGKLETLTGNYGSYYTQQMAGVTVAQVMEYGKEHANLKGLTQDNLKKVGVGLVEKDGKVWIYVLTSF